MKVADHHFRPEPAARGRANSSSPADTGAALAATVAGAFFFSGAAALVYQVCWQRVLFASLGVDIESVTVIVSTFMLGLGIGALAGGWLADRFGSALILLFAACEAGIGLFGLVSVDLIRGVAAGIATAPRLAVGAATFALLLLPTALMGATLPMLVTHFVRRNGSVGVSIGGLYFANTLGAAAGCYLAGFVWFHFFDLPLAVRAAAAMNLLVAASCAWMGRRR